MNSQWLPIVAVFLLTAANGIAQQTSGGAPAEARQGDSEHIVSREELHQMAANLTVQREKDDELSERLLATDLASEALTRMHLNGTRIDQAINQLSNEELERLAARANQAASKVASGSRLGKTRLLFIVIALATAGMVLITT